ncbi:MAG: ABC transporter permease [Phycisphaerales bacterium]
MTALLRAVLRGFVGDPGTLILAFVAPVAFFSLFAIFFRHLDSPTGVAFEVAIVAPQENAAAQRFRTAIESRPHGRIHIADAGAPGATRAPDAVIELAPDFSERNLRIAIRSDAPLPGVADAVRELAIAAASEAFHGPVPATIEDQTVGGSLLAASAAGVAVMFALLSCSSLALRGLTDEGAGFHDRLCSLRIGATARVAARAGATAIISFLQLAWTFLFAAIVFRVEVSSPLLLLVACACVAAALATTVIALAAACRTRARFASISPVVTLVLTGLGGSMIPVALLPPILAAPSHIMVTAWAIQACEAGVRGRQAWLALALLLAWTAAMLLIARAMERRTQP